MKRSDLPKALNDAITTYCVLGNPCYRPDFVEALRQVAPELIPVPRLVQIWTEKMVQTEALKYKTKSRFKEKERSAYKWAESMGILDQICHHMNTINPSNYWTEERVIAEASKYTTRRDLKVGCLAAYSSARRLGILDRACQHMVTLNKSWTEADLMLEAQKYKTRLDFRLHCQYAHNRSKRLGILDKVCQHMVAYCRKPMSEETKNKISAAQKGIRKPRKT